MGSNSIGPPLKTSRNAMPRSSVRPRQDLLKFREELRPPRLGAAEGLLLIRPEARLLHAQTGPGACWRERKGHDTFEIVGRIVVRKIPRVRERSVRLDRQDLA